MIVTGIEVSESNSTSISVAQDLIDFAKAVTELLFRFCSYLRKKIDYHTEPFLGARRINHDTYPARHAPLSENGKENNMFTRNLTLRAAMVVAGLGMASGLAAAPQAGPADAVAVCRAVLQDDVSELSRLLADYRIPSAYSVVALAPGSGRLRDARNGYLCNNMALDEFAAAVGAERTTEMLAGESTEQKDLVAESDEVGPETRS